MNTNAKIFLIVIGVLVLGTIVTVILRGGGGATGPGKYDEFAMCLKDNGAMFYGAYWCPHCQAQKKMFGSSAKLLPYTECSTVDGNAQTQICIDKEIKSYPTWEFADSTRLTGEISLLELAQKTNCPLPDSVATPTPIEAGASSVAQ